ncbi:translation initiation factor IF-2-like [Amphibalanus amphitrite]|uniref:translation initiation factor IF-2-like n=1 Tax=Amphibalanus amphitrite TaxID=1232801 RepID=UPI001C90C026|nr:translation initiation factor IF-2-like [Amphibalanus amphitrite]
MDTLREQYGYTDPADGSDSSSAEDSDEAGSSSKTRKASKKWRSKKFQSLLSWKKREKPQQTLTKITLRPPSERSLVGGDRGGCSPPAPRLVLQVREACSAAGRPVQTPSGPAARSPVSARAASLTPLSVSPAVSPTVRPTPSGGRPGSVRLGQGAAAAAPASPGRSPLLAPPPPPCRPRSLSLQPDSAHRCPSGGSRLAPGPQRLSLRLCVSPSQRPPPPGRGQLPNSSLRLSQPAGRALRAPDVTEPPDVSAPADSDVTECDATSREAAALRGLKLSEDLPKQSGVGGTVKKKKMKAKKGRKVKVKPKVSK